MRVAHYTLIAGVVLGAIGFVAAAFLDKRQLGMTIFMIGFFVGAASAVYAVLMSARGGFGKIELPIKIAAGGFGLTVLGQGVGLLLDKGSSFGSVFFFVGLAVIMIGIFAALLQMVKF